MHANDSVLDDCRQRKPVEKVVQALPCANAVSLSHALDALEPEPEQRVDISRLVISTYQMYMGRMLDLQGEQQANGLEGVRTAVNVVSQEQIVDVCDIPRRRWRAVFVEQPHKITKLAV